MRTGQRPAEVFDALLERGQVVIHPSEVERTAALARIGATAPMGAEGQDQLIITDTRDQVAALNAAIRDHRHTTTSEPGSEPRDDFRGESGEEPAGERSDEVSGELVTRRGERLGLGDRVATRRNDRDLGVANRDTWTVTGINQDGSVLVAGRAGERTLPIAYVADHVELAFATTAYGAQGESVHAAHFALGESTGAASAYVAMTRGRRHNTARLVAASLDEARSHWVEVLNRDRADLGPHHAADQAAEAIERYGSNAPGPASPTRLAGAEDVAAALQAAALHSSRRRPPEPIPPNRPGPTPASTRGVSGRGGLGR